MRILVSGATGFIGSHACAALGAAGHTIRVMARNPQRVDAILKPRGIEIHEVAKADMTDATSVAKALEGCDAAVHMAATMYGGADVLEANVAGVRNVVGQACERGLDPILYTSSIASMFPPPDGIHRVDDPVVSLKTTYGFSKSEGERYVRSLQAEGAPVVTIYPAGVYGPEDPVLGEASKGLRDRLRFTWFDTTGGTACVDVRDVAKVIAAALEPGKGPRRFMAGGHFLTWMEEAALVERLTGRRVRRLRIPPAALRGVGRLLDWGKQVVAFDYPLTHEAAQFVTMSVPCDNTGTTKALGVEFRATEETLGDAIRWLHRAGHIDARFVGKLASAG